jgi:multicomponent Na+:H+ antiporter subunit D
VNFWLPASYHTPRVVVQALFAGLLTKVGIYALLRVMVMLLPIEREALSFAIALMAALTMILGAMGALAQNDIRRFLGFVVIAGIGNIMAGVAIGGSVAVGAAIFYALHSILLMTALYLVSGEMGRLGGSFGLDRLGGLWAAFPVFAVLSLALFFAASGLPPFSGFWPKAILVKAAIDIGAWWLAASVLFSGFLTTIAFGRLFLFAFWRPAAESAGAEAAMPGGPPPTLSPSLSLARTENRWRLAPIVLLSAFVIGFGLFPERLIVATQQAATDLSNPAAYIRSVFPEGGAR